jgi:hypothetical protein
MQEFTLSEAQEKLLREQVIDEEHPGSVLRDFQMVLDFVGTRGVKAGGEYNLLPITSISTLDERLTRPLRLKLIRPQLRSHPYLQGLHLLLRASGLTRVEGMGKKAVLMVDAPALEAWNALNATEKYFTLLEALLFLAEPVMVGERVTDRDSGLLDECLRIWEAVPARGRSYDLAHPEQALAPGYGRSWYLVALLDLFGLMKMEHPAFAVQPWIPERIEHTAFGDALFTLVCRWESGSWGADRDEPDENAEEDEEADEGLFGVLQEELRPYFPEWRANLRLPEPEWQGGIFVFRVSPYKDVWRLLALSSDHTLEDLAQEILRSVNFDNDHLYEFIYRDRFGGTVRVMHPACREGLFTDEVELGGLELIPGQSMTFHYDFGDDWRFDVKLERIEPPNPKAKLPRIVEKHGKSPEQYPDAEWY